ncbi:MAG: hypothetical protein LBJ13_03640, partial [Puniceicoccales bacterium]|nr:hypothetical protein [Puniceicoccales bacterium]
MDIFTKISLFSSIGIISSGIFLPESKALYEKIEEVEKKVKTRSRNFTPVNGEISIGGLNYEISSQMDGNERITTITPFLGETQLSISKEFRKDKKDFGTKTPGIDQKLNQLIINSNKVIAKDNTFSPDARAAAIGRLDAFYVS